MALNRDAEHRAYCAGATASGRNCRKVADKSGYCERHRPAGTKEAKIDYSRLTFKELLAACPLENIDLERTSDIPKTTDF